MQIKKIGFVGNLSTGKTTAAVTVVRDFKVRKYKTGHIKDLGRFVTWPPEMFDTHPEARLNVLFRQAANECAQQMRNDVEFLICDCTMVDWFLYYEWTCNNIGVPVEETVKALVNRWTDSYDLLLYMDSTSMHYINDGYRPASTKLRDEIDGAYRKWFEAHRGRSNVLHIQAPEIEDRCKEVTDKVMRWVA